MIKYILLTHDGEVIQGHSPDNILQELKSGSKFCSGQTDEEFMTGFADRWKEYSGLEVTYNSVEEFIEQLKSTGYFIEP